jgi:CRISPR-associated exonuclease Cas4
MTQLILLGLLLILALIAIGAFWQSRRLRLTAGLPLHSRVVYSDTGAWKKVERPLFSSRYLLSGKPDYVVDEGNARIPIEVKPDRTAGAPRLSDVLQLAAYGLLVEETFGAPSSYGLLKYRESIFRVEFTQELRAQLVRVLDEIRGNLTAEDLARSHADPRRCHACGYRASCGQDIS